MKKKVKKKSAAGKIIVGITAAIFLLYGVYLTVLRFAGSTTMAEIQSFRREMGERDETIRNQYTYAYDYEFTVGGKKYSGTSKKVQGPLFLKHQKGSFIKVHYLQVCPSFSCPEDDFTPWYKIPIYFAVGMVLIGFMFKMK